VDDLFFVNIVKPITDLSNDWANIGLFHSSIFS